MNGRQKAFADYYIECGNAAEAAKKAGYSEKTAYSQGNRMLKNVEVLEYIQSRTSTAEQKRMASGDEVMQFFTMVMDGEVTGAVMSDRISAGREILRREVSDRKLAIELLKLESRMADVKQEPDMDDGLLDALNSVAVEVWGGDKDNGGTADG